jgi:2-iminobutanoate/2-iminopropanoate deaminase
MPPTDTPAKVQHLEGTDHQKSRSFSPAVITEGGKTVWLAGQTTVTDLEGKDIAGKFDEQARTISRSSAAPSSAPAARSPTW